jgi:hypothetical protein
VNAAQLNAFAVRLLKGDTILNLILGFAFIALPGPVEDLLGDGPLIPFIAWRVIGAIFVLFAVWEFIVTRRPPLSAASLAFASFMALAPTVLLAATLLFFPLPLNAFGRVVLWLGVLVMLLLGVYYAQVIWRTRREGVGPT